MISYKYIPLDWKTYYHIRSIQGCDDLGHTRKIAVDSDGQLISVMKGTDGTDLQIIKVDSDGQMYARMKGAFGATPTDIAVDADGNMIAVMKGDYEGALKTWKVDEDGRGEMFISDPIDVWGSITTMGLSELATRMQAPPMTFIRSGNVLRYVDFESATPNYQTTTTGSPTHGRSTDVACHGSHSYKAASTGSNDTVDLSIILNDFHTTKIGLQAKFSTASTGVHIYLEFRYYDGSDLYTAGIRYRPVAPPSTGYVQYNSVAHGYDTFLFNTPHYLSIYNISTVKLTIDLANLTYTKTDIFGTEHSMGQAIPSSSNSAAKHLEAITRLNLMSNGNTAYIDSIILTENEP